jgi:hypothetical protein
MRPGRHPRWTPAEPRVALGGQIRTLRVATPQTRSRPNSSGDRAADYRARAESVPDRKLRALDVRTAVRAHPSCPSIAGFLRASCGGLERARASVAKMLRTLTEEWPLEPAMPS